MAQSCAEVGVSYYFIIFSECIVFFTTRIFSNVQHAASESQEHLGCCNGTRVVGVDQMCLSTVLSTPIRLVI